MCHCYTDRIYLLIHILNAYFNEVSLKMWKMNNGLILFDIIAMFDSHPSNDSDSVRNTIWWVPKFYFKVITHVSCMFWIEQGLKFSPFFPKLMGLGTHSSKIHGFPGTHGTHPNKATVWISCHNQNAVFEFSISSHV